MGKNKSLSAAFGRKLVCAYMRLMYRPKVYYQSPEIKAAIKEGNLIIVGNHVGHNDGQIFYMIFKNSALLLAKDWAEKKLLRWITKGGHFIPVDRAGMDVAWISAARQELKEGRNMIIFPEGHTSQNGMDEFKPGFAMLAVLSGARILPVYLDGQYHKLFGKRLRLYVGNPTELTAEGKGPNAEYLRKECLRIQSIVADLNEGH